MNIAPNGVARAEALKQPSSRATGVVLMYHRVCDTDSDLWQLAVSTKNFEEQLSVLARYTVVPLSEIAHTDGGIAITFDDGYLDNLTEALPVLEKYGLPATVFVASNALQGREFWWDRLEHTLLDEDCAAAMSGQTTEWPQFGRSKRVEEIGGKLRSMGPRELEKALSEIPAALPANAPACSRHRMMNEEQLRILAASPLIEIGGHTCTHPSLPQLSESEQEEEIATSRRILQDITGQEITSFAYPYGHYDERSPRAVERAGFKRACIVGGGLVRSNSDPFQLPRQMARNFGRGRFTALLALFGAVRWFM